MTSRSCGSLIEEAEAVCHTGGLSAWSCQNERSLETSQPAGCWLLSRLCIPALQLRQISAGPCTGRYCGLSSGCHFLRRRISPSNIRPLRGQSGSHILHSPIVTLTEMADVKRADAVQVASL